MMGKNGKKMGMRNMGMHTKEMDKEMAEKICAMKRSEAYTNPKHPDHKKVVEQVSAAYGKGYKEKK